MHVLKRLRNLAQKNLFLRKFIGYYLASSGLFDSFFKNYKLSPPWEVRVKNVLSSRDNDFIPKVKDAGHIRRGKQIMHNGLKIHLGSYYGPEYSRMLSASRGVHEPQEERVFMEVLKTLPSQSLMIEMGAFWSFYSMWFQKELKDSINYMIEPDSFNMGQGKRNFELNNLKGSFIQAYIGKQSSQDGAVKTMCIDDFVKEHSIKFIHMLHSDIQGFEYDMLVGASRTFDLKQIGYVFVSTHSNDLHNQCLKFLIERKFIIIAEANLDESFSEDGLIAARAPHFDGVTKIEISKRSPK